MEKSILLVEDNPEIMEVNAAYLKRQGFSVTTADSGIRAMACLDGMCFDCIVLDILLPDMDGIALCRAARTVTDAPILFLSCLDELDDKLKGLMSGGDDYMTKPYSLKELAARIHVLLRRAGRVAAPGPISVSIDRERRILHTRSGSVLLSPQEFALFTLLYENPGSTFSRGDLFKKAWADQTGDAGIVAVYVMRLRRKLESLEPCPLRIESEYGAGYRLVVVEGGT